MKRLVLPVLSILAACTPEYAKMSNVVPLPDSTYEVSSSWETKEQAMHWALDAAEATCDKRKMRHVVTGQEVAYKGMLGEEDGGQVEMIKSVAESIGIPGASSISLRSKQDYTVTLKFRCEAAWR